MSTNLHESDSLVPSLAFDVQGPPRDVDEASLDRMIGQRIGNFQIDERLGAGAMASIYRAKDTTTGGYVALKMLNATADDVLRERFRIEARTVRVLQHPHIVQIIDAGQTDEDIIYLVMELVDGEDLGTFLEKQHQLSVLDSCRLLHPIAAALAYAHAAGVIHRDVKPSNILLRRVPLGTPGSVQLTGMDAAIIPLLSDFGIARAVDAPELTTLGRTIGTPAYMSPEQCAGKRLLDGRADIYSLGTVLYRSLVGRAPFVGATTQILHAHVYESLTIPDIVWRSLPPSILTILQKTLQKEPDDRYATAGALADDLALMIQDATPANATVTMPSLPVTGSPADAMTQVLVPGLSEKTKERPVIPWIPAAAPITPPTRTSSVTSLARRPRRPTNWAAVLLGILLTTGLVIMGFVALTAVIPRFGLSLLLPGAATSIVLTPESTSDVTIPVGNAPPPTGSAAAFANANSSETAVGTSADTGIITPTVTTLAVLPSPNMPVPTAMTSEVTTTPTTVIVVTSTTPTVDPQLIPITVTLPLSDDLDVAATWQDVQHYYQGGEWGQARWSLMTMLSARDGIPGLASNNRQPVTQAQQINDLLLSAPNTVYWGKWIDTFTVEEVGQILADIYISLAHEELINAPNLSDLPTQTTDYLIAAATVRSSATLVRQLSAITTRFLAASDEQKTFYIGDLVNASIAYAEDREAAAATCVAYNALASAKRLAPDTIDSTLVETYKDECKHLAAVAAPVSPPQPFSGTIYYSTQIDNEYSIWRSSVNQPESTSLVIRNATQPSLYANYLAFYSRRSDSEGLSGVDLNSGFGSDERFARYTGAIEDARESPARWNPTGSRLVFSSADAGDGIPRLFIVPAEYNSAKSVLGPGEDPIWSLDGTAILYRDIGASGNTPGLLLRSLSDGSTQRLTNGDDHRPIWTPDGRYIIFMRRVDDRNWELYRLSVGTKELVQLTDNPAQDGLPALSPDGNTIVFASDRTGGWQLWTIAMDESEVAGSKLTVGQARLLMPIQGTFLRWLEHSIQWVN